jgi:single-strand DNA-binding protein
MVPQKDSKPSGIRSENHRAGCEPVERKTVSINNSARFNGNLGADPEFKETKGDPVCSIRVASNEQWKDKDGNKQTRTEWMTIVFWGKSAELINKHFQKGDGICTRGQLRTRSWEDNDGHKNYKTEIYADRFDGWSFPPGKKGSGGGGRRADGDPGPSDDGGYGGSDSGGGFGGADDDIPF